MQASINRFINRQQLNKDVLRKRTATAAILAVFVIIAVFWWLKLIGITLAGEACCGFVEHTHSDECITRTLICGYEEEENNETLDLASIITTVYAEEISSEEISSIDTPLPSGEITSEIVPDESDTGTIEEDVPLKPPQTQTDEALEPAELTESESGDIVSPPSSGLDNPEIGIEYDEISKERPEDTEIREDENTSHTHTDECYEITYSCGLDEHIHDASCYSDEDADVEAPSDWEEDFVDVELSADLGANLIAIAQTQLGYEESTKNYQIDAEKEKHGYTRYGEWYGSPYNKWSAIFVQFCLYYSGIDGDSLEYYAGIERLRSVWEESGILSTLDEHTPIPGDIIFIDDDNDEKADYAGIISEETSNEYTIIIGDYENRVCEITLEKSAGNIIGMTIADKILEASTSETTKERIDFVTSEIDKLPSFEEISQTLSEFDANDDIDGYSTYFSAVVHKSHGVYAVWEDLHIYRSLITNYDKLETYRSIWTTTLALTETPTVYQINYYYSEDRTLLVSGNGTIRDIVGNRNSFFYWDMYVVAKDDAGYYVSNIVTTDGQKWNNSPGNGFIFLMYRDTWDVQIGDRIEANCPLTGVYKQSDNNGAGYGTLSVVTSNNLTPISSADTSEFIEVNLYDYDNNINTQYNSNINYPGFQQEYGTTYIGTNLTTGSFNFGNNITTDYDAGITGITNDGGAINATTRGANAPVQGTMNYNLIDGYPTLAYNNLSLDWLFSNSPANGVQKKNTSNINGLFLYDEESGFYYFDSREHHAQYNKETGNFDLYAEHLTPNFLMYPFGNFLPLNDINLQATKVTNINKAYFNGQANKAKTKYTNTQRAEYNTLSNMLNTFSTKMGTSFTYLDAVNKYFSLVSETPSSVPSSAFTNMYNLDYAEASNFYFGMDMHMNFMMTKNGTTGPNGDIPLYFDFNGDDDVWVYVDNKLFLDLSGIHRHVGGRIDFQNGRVEYYQFNPASGQADISIDTGLTDANGNEYSYVNDRGKTIYYVPFSVLLGPTAADLIDPQTGTFYPYTNHPFDFYYMERGSGSSVCRMEFTIPLLQKNSITVTKEMTSEDNLDVLGNPDFAFQILKTDKTTPFIGEGVTYSILDANTQKEISTGTTKANGVFTLKAGQTAVFSNIQENAGSYFVRELLDTTVFEQYGTVTVDGKSTTTSSYTDIAIGTDSFKGVDSDIKNIGDGSTAFAFTNHIDITKYGALSLGKRYNEYQSGIEPQTVTLEVLMGGEPIALGSQYTVINSDGVYTVKQVTTKGRISFRSDERVLFPKLLAGTKVTVRETTESSAGYDVSYTTIKDFTITTYQDEQGVYCEGLIPAKNPLPITVHNERSGEKLAIPVIKTLLHPDGTEHTYNFILERIMSLTDHTTDGFYIRTPVSLSDGTENFEFTLNYPPGTASGKYYYMIREEDANRQNGMDLTRHIAEVTVSTSDGTTSVVLTGYYREDGTPIHSREFSFENRVVRTLTIGKTVQGIQTSDVFKFEIKAYIGEMPLTGTFYYADDTGTENGALTFENGVATVSLTHGKKITVYGLPYGTGWTVTELNTSGFFAKYMIDNGDIINGNEGTGTLSADSSIHFYNIGGYELPSTGSSLRLWFIIMGWALVLLPLIIGYLMRRRAERRLR